jgi:hypothetical protein
MPRLLYFNEVHKFVKKAWQESIPNIAPVPRTNIARASRQTMSATNPTIINIISNIIDPFWNPTPYRLDFVQTFFGNPPTDWILGLSGLFPF